jgi:hypothetical protein
VQCLLDLLQFAAISPSRSGSVLFEAGCEAEIAQRAKQPFEANLDCKSAVPGPDGELLSTLDQYEL